MFKYYNVLKSIEKNLVVFNHSQIKILSLFFKTFLKNLNLKNNLGLCQNLYCSIKRDHFFKDYSKNFKILNILL